MYVVETQSWSSCVGDGAVHERRLPDDGQITGYAPAGGKDLFHRLVEGQNGGRFPSVITE